MSPLLISAILATLIATAYLYVQHIFSYWKRRGVPYAKPYFPFGNFGLTFTNRKRFGQTLQDLYESVDDAPILGIFMGLRPAVMFRDPKIIRDILVKDFQYFLHRGLHLDENVDPLANNMFLQNGEKWKEMRAKLSPTFTSGKLKVMFETIVSCGKPLGDHLNRLVATNTEIEVRDIFARFTTNVIASVAFGIEVDCFADPDNEFREYAWRFFEPTFKNLIRFNSSFLSPFLTKLFGARFADKDVGEFMKDTVRQNLEYRERNNVSRKDFFQLLMQLRNTGKVEEDNADWSTKASSGIEALSLDDMAAQAYLFLIAGFESSSTTMTFWMYEMAKNPEIQRKAYEEIINTLRKHDGKLSYEALKEMRYLDTCIDETLRLHPPFESFTRECTQDYKVANTDVIIEKGTPVIFSVLGPQYDPKYYDELYKFNPDRFKDDQSANKNSLETPYLVFGDGPRNCVGMRLGKIQAKIGVCLLLKNFLFELGEQHINKPLVLSNVSGVRAPINGMKLKVQAR